MKFLKVILFRLEAINVMQSLSFPLELESTSLINDKPLRG